MILVGTSEVLLHEAGKQVLVETSKVIPHEASKVLPRRLVECTLETQADYRCNN